MAIPTILIVEEPERDLYGRVKEKAAISVAYDQCMDLATAMRGSEKSHVILVHGPSGSGKTALLQHVFEERIRQEGGFFIYGKFDSVPSARPWPAIVDAFSDLCVQCLASERRSKIRKALCEELESDVNQLSHLIPNFKALVDGFLGSDDDTEENGDWNDIQASFRRNEFGFTRIKLLFQRFLRAICHPISSPIVLLLDDVQWADQSSLLLIEALLSEGEPVSGFLLAITSDEPGLFRRAQVNRDLVNATKIRIRNLSKNDWIEMTKQTLKKAKSYIAAEELDILFKKTMGNPFLTVLCVKAIDEGGLLKELEIEADNGVKAGILSVIKGRLSRLAKPAQDALFLGACFGLRFCMDWVAPLVPTYGSTRNASLQPDVMPLNWGSGRLDDSEHLSESELKETLNEAIVNGLVTKRCGIPWYEFTHHSIRDAAYDLFRNSSCKRERIHLLIGEHTLRKVRFSSSSEDDTILWTAVDHLNLGSSQLHEERKLIELARLNGRAAEKSMLKLAFFSAAQYASAGLEKIGRVGGWQTDFAVTWELSTHLCRMYSCLGEHEACKRVANDVVSRSSSIFEKLGAFEAVMESSRVEGNVEEAFNIGFDVLRSLNEPFPNRVSKALLIWEIVKTKRILTRKTLKDLSGLPKMADERACATVRFLKLLSLTFFAMGNYFSYFVASLRIVRLSTKYGVARESPKAFVVFGNILSQTSRHFNEASRYMSVALSLGEKAGKSGRAQSLAVGSWILTPLQGTVSEAVGQALYGYRLAMECGEVVCACTSVLSYCGLYFWSGLPIPPLMKDLPTFLTMLSEYKQVRHFKF
jgi:predicted ATPase